MISYIVYINNFNLVMHDYMTMSLIVKCMWRIEPSAEQYISDKFAYVRAMYRIEQELIK